MHPDFDEFLEQLEEMIGYEGEVYKLTGDEEDEEGEGPGEPPLWVVIYDDVPDDGSITAFTYGLSRVSPTDGGDGLGRELVLSIESDNIDWGFAAGFLAKSMRGKCPFEKGNVIKFGERVVKESGLNAFVVYTPTVLDEDQCVLELEEGDIEFMQIVPIYEEEIPVLEKLGVDAFFADESFDIYKVNRPKRTG